VGDIELRYEHLGKHRETSARKKRREQLHAHIDEIWAEQEQRNQAMGEAERGDMPSLQVADRYAGGKSGSAKSH
jgi:crotonobetainyl-CoA:carnitine CoA-transferase CaiB-like acyl-CoA transferase